MVYVKKDVMNIRICSRFLKGIHNVAIETLLLLELYGRRTKEVITGFRVLVNAT